MASPLEDVPPTDSLLINLPIHESLEELYQSTPWSVSSCESYEMDQLLYALQTPAHQSLFVLQHAFSVFGDINTVLSHCRHLWKPNSEFGGSRLEALLKQQQQQKQQLSIEKDDNNCWRHNNKVGKGQASKKIADAIASLQGSKGHSNSSKAQNLLYALHFHLYLTLGTDLRNGAAADIALSLSMAGIGHDNHHQSNEIRTIFDILAHIAALELERKKTKGSRRSTDILMVVEKLAAAGCTGQYMGKASAAAVESLEGSKGYEHLSEDMVITNDFKWKLWSPRSLLWLWRRGHLLHKVSEEDISSSLTLQILQPPVFDDPTLPLVVDVGCGLGVSLIGLLASSQTAADTKQQSPSTESRLDFDWKRCNYLGGDLSPAAIRWATGLTARWKLSGQCQFYHVSTETLLDYLLQSMTRVAVILLQFPTPYRLQQEEEEDAETARGGCNLKLPSGPNDDSFMANPRILERMAKLLGQRSNNQLSYLLVQSNCEDVALQIADTLTQLGLKPVSSEKPTSLDYLASTTPTTRTETWLKEQEQIGNHPVKRASGAVWSAEPYLPIFTETEAACIHQGTPVHRCLFRTPT